MKILLHIDEPNKWSLVLGNIKNVLANGEENNTTYELEVLANSMAVFQLREDIAKNSNLLNQVNEYSKKGVVFAVCNNSLKKFNIDPKELISFCKVVPAGIIELAKKQSEGYLYIKP
ncbi:DsrE family protein [Clostridium sp. B9]|uniref:DsrE family protein n=1 Tax=Clostridium sp. B9 TaxID=3423224 RepID=UPI003D2EE71A